MSTVDLHWPTRSHASRPLLKAGGAAGLLMLPVFATTVAGLTRAEWQFLHGLGWTVAHAHDVNYPSSLARGRLGKVQSLNFAVLGLLTSLFARRWSRTPGASAVPPRRRPSGVAGWRASASASADPRCS
jgi:hypothetical protein